MGLYHWDQKYELGIKTIDIQHKQLIKIVNDLHTAMKEGKTERKLGVILISLIQYTKTHFTTEESLLERYHYIKLSEQQKEHADFISKMELFKNDFENGKTAITMKMMSYLGNWLVEHILQKDKEYVSLLKENGVL